VGCNLNIIKEGRGVAHRGTRCCRLLTKVWEAQARSVKLRAGRNNRIPHVHHFVHGEGQRGLKSQRMPAITGRGESNGVTKKPLISEAEGNKTQKTFSGGSRDVISHARQDRNCGRRLKKSPEGKKKAVKHTKVSAGHLRIEGSNQRRSRQKLPMQGAFTLPQRTAQPGPSEKTRGERVNLGKKESQFQIWTTLCRRCRKEKRGRSKWKWPHILRRISVHRQTRGILIHIFGNEIGTRFLSCRPGQG